LEVAGKDLITCKATESISDIYVQSWKPVHFRQTTWSHPD